jgi:hypothetical protein
VLRELPQDKIQAWIERILEHIERIVKSKGGNEYKEGRNHAIRTGDPEDPEDSGGDEEESQWIDTEYLEDLEDLEDSGSDV